MLRPAAELPHLGKPLPLLDAPAYVTGQAIFGADVTLPGMLTAVIARPPVVGGKVARFDATRALAVPGVRKVIEMPAPKPPYAFQPWGGVAVVADHTWAAHARARRARRDVGSRTERELRLRHVPRGARQGRAAPGTVARKVGDAEAALKGPRGSSRPSTTCRTCRTCRWSPSSRWHGSTATAARSGRRPRTRRRRRPRSRACWASPHDKVRVHVTFLGGGFGRKSKADFCSEAALLSRQLRRAGARAVDARGRRPSRLRQHRQHPAADRRAGRQRARRRVAPPHRVPADWQRRSARPPSPDSSDLQQGVLDLALAVPNVSAEICEATAHTRIGWLRSVYNIFQALLGRLVRRRDRACEEARIRARCGSS